MPKTKKRILDAARTLFNEYGFSQVTIRMIALELDMSSGNLNYHFKKREDILEALYFEMVAVFDQRVEGVGASPITLETVKKDVGESLERMIAYRFFWTDLYYLLRRHPNIKKHFFKAAEARKKGYEF